MRRQTLTLTLLAVTLAGCGGSDDDGVLADSSGVVTAGGSGATASAAGTFDETTAGLTDANVLYILDQANVTDSAHGALAVSMATRGDVKSYGRLMTSEHHALREEGKSLAARLGVVAQAPESDRSERSALESLDRLRRMARGADWDRAYLDHEVAYHAQTLETARQAAATTSNAEIRALLERAAPVVERHLARARELQSGSVPR